MYADTMYIPQDIHDVYRRHRPYCSTRTTLKVAGLGAGGGGGGGGAKSAALDRQLESQIRLFS